MNNKTLILTTIVLSQFFGTSLWFSSNAVLEDIANAHHLQTNNLLANLTIATQVGFILGSLLYALFNLADKYKANFVFSLSVFLAAFSNASIALPNLNFETVFTSRFFTGFFLAGVYPVGMKIAAHFFPKTISKALGILVGALVLGTGFPHLTASLNFNFPWKSVVLTSSTLAFIGGFMMYFLDTPAKKTIQKIDFSILPQLFQKKNFTKASIGYFGHMWELYTFWAFIPLLLHTFSKTHQQNLNVSLWSFIVITSGTIGCIFAGKKALLKGNKTVSKWALYTSGLCCLLCPLFFNFPPYVFIPFLLIWGFTVVADSPLLSSMINQFCIKSYNGTALTLSTSIGFSVTILSIFIFNLFLRFFPIQYIFMLLSVGPILSIISLKKLTEINY